MRTLLWTLATFLASPLLLMGARARRRDAVEKVLVVQLAKLGDMVCTTPIFRALKESYPQAQVHVLCRRGASVAIQNNPFVDAIHYDEGSRLRLVSRLRREKYDWSIGCMPSTFASMVGIWSMVPRRVHTPSSHHGILMRLLSVFNQCGFAYPIRTRTFDHYMKLLSPMGIKPVPYGLDFTVTGEAQRKVKDWMRRERLSPGSFVILNITAGNAIKQWPTEKFIQLADRIDGELKKQVVFSTLDSALVTRVRFSVTNSDNTHDASALSIEELGGLSKSAAAFVSVDTGPLFIAFACGCPVVIIMGGSHPNEQIPPQGQKVVHVLPPQGCEPWIFVSRTPRKGTPEQLRCIHDTSQEDVFTALRRVVR